MKTIVVVATLLCAAGVLWSPEAAQRVVVPPGPGIIAAPGQDHALTYRRWVAVTHTGDYLQQAHQFYDAAWQTRTSLFGINGTDRVADIGVYVLGRGDLYLSVFHHVEPGREQRILPGDRYFGPGPNLPSTVDDQPPEYRGETIVVVSSEPVIVTGAVIRGYNHRPFLDPDHLDLPTDRVAASQSSRILDVRQFNCSVRADFEQVAQFCRLSPREE